MNYVVLAHDIGICSKCNIFFCKVCTVRAKLPEPQIFCSVQCFAEAYNAFVEATEKYKI